MVRIVDKAEEAFYEWRESSVLKRQGVMLSYGGWPRTAHATRVL
jgi:hypothetical protein